MPKSIKFRQQTKTGSESRVVEGTFEDWEWADIERFVEFTDRIAENGIVRNEHPISANTTWTDGVPTSQVTLPPVEVQESFLLRMRMVLLQKEPTSFGKIANHLRRRIDDTDFRQGIDVFKRQFAGDGIQSMMTVRAYDAEKEILEITSDKALDAWLNGELYHGDPDMRELLRRTHSVYPSDSSRVLFLFMLLDKALASINLAGLIRVLDGKQKEFSFDTRRRTFQ